MQGATFGTKFEGLKVSMDLPKEIPGLFHAGSVGIIMSGWLGAINYGVIVANEVDSFLFTESPAKESLTFRDSDVSDDGNGREVSESPHGAKGIQSEQVST